MRFSTENTIESSPLDLNSTKNSQKDILNEFEKHNFLTNDNINLEINNSDTSNRMSISNFELSQNNLLNNWIKDFTKSIDSVMNLLSLKP